MKPGRYLAVDQFGDRVYLNGHPRKELLEHHHRQHTDKVYQDKADGRTMHVGYIVAGRWFTLYQPVEEPA